MVKGIVEGQRVITNINKFHRNKCTAYLCCGEIVLEVDQAADRFVLSTGAFTIFFHALRHREARGGGGRARSARRRPASCPMTSYDL